MAEIDDELVTRAIRWCAASGGHATAAQVREALAPLSWDQLLAARALLADPPPPGPLGPRAIADLSRSPPADAATGRGQPGTPDLRVADLTVPAPGLPRPGRSRCARQAAPIRIRRVRDRAIAPPTPAPPRPLVERLAEPEGRGVIEALVRRRGARVGPLLAELAKRYRRGDDGAPLEEDLRALLAHHGLSRAFERRERDEALHALRAAGGQLAGAAARLGMDRHGLEELLRRSHAAREAEGIREERRAALRARATLSERARLVVEERARLGDLGLLEEFAADLRSRLPEHLRALGATGVAPLGAALARSLSLPRGDAEALAAELGIPLQPGTATARRPAHRHPAGRAPPRPATRERAAGRRRPRPL